MTTFKNTMIYSVTKEYLRGNISKIEAAQKIKKYYGYVNLMAAKKEFDRNLQSVLDIAIAED